MVADVDMIFLQCDIMSLKSILAASQSFLSCEHRLHILIANAGITVTAIVLTADDVEAQFGVHHVAHALFIKTLLPDVQHTAKISGHARIVIV